MFLRGEESLPYTILLSAAAPHAVQLALCDLSWPLIFLLFALPSLSLLVSLGYLSQNGPVLTFQRIAPISAGVGWAMVWLASEKLYIEGLRGAQTISYAAYSVRSNLNWAIECGHSYNTPHCVPFLEENVTHSESERFPDNFWPAQQFNRYAIRGNDIEKDNLTLAWEPNEWYLGSSKESFYLGLPSFVLLLSSCLMWTLVTFITTRFEEKLGWILSNFCLAIPAAVYFFVVVIMTFTTFHFGPSIQDFIPADKVEIDPIDYWGDIKGLLRTSLVSVDYSTAFSGLILFATSKKTTGSNQMNVFFLLLFLMVPPLLLSVIRFGCEGHLALLQPAYRYYPSTEETFTLDVLPVCFATSKGGPVLSLLFYIAHFAYSSLAPIIVYLLLIHQSITDQWPEAPRHLIIPAIIAAFTIPSLLLYMPMGTKIVAAFRYLSQSSILHLVVYFTVFFVYGWQRLEADLQSTVESPSSIFAWMFSVTGPLCTFLLFTFVPMLLCAHFTSVFDLLMTGSDVLRHIDLGIGQLVLAPQFISRFVGVLFMLAPTIIIVAAASLALYRNYAAHLSIQTLFEPTTSFLSHSTLAGQTQNKPHSLAYGFFNQILPDFNLRLAFTIVFIFEIITWFVVTILFGWNIIVLYIGKGSENANMYRCFVLLLFASLHAIALFEMRMARQRWDTSERLMVYIATATMETAMLNGYMWTFSSDHTWGLDAMPLLFAIFATLVRGLAIFTVIAVRAHISDVSRPTRTRDATEVYEAEMRMGDEEDDSPIIFELAR
ncbi:hypothetical protein PFISCL1PPCAC_8207 [Pristionchus fissidentatus]|uniref:G protein-coupled receptor n=1 Tax=Pristionchus fissidentatus TaxID=1538716 RepID=A0AAV5VB57_9BILA|nr:hypothetical protein PFISCL1PPCAC_8207 [Pristionchus fissidentatus]